MFILDSIRRSKILIEDSFFWLFFSLIVLLLSLFPNAAVYFSRLLGFESPANFVFSINHFFTHHQPIFYHSKIVSDRD
ncbi:DUF2304 domain-containing protein [Streptococcus equi]|uniref:DUF2304 domain-containing protein n=1 Tax=Streptococcus equi TaxID=1336 RepID=UPI0032D8FBCF